MAYQYTCGLEDCAFQVRSEDRHEVVSAVQEHAENKHGTSVDQDDVESGMQEV